MNQIENGFREKWLMEIEIDGHIAQFARDYGDDILLLS